MHKRLPVKAPEPRHRRQGWESRRCPKLHGRCDARWGEAEALNGNLLSESYTFTRMTATRECGCGPLLPWQHRRLRTSIFPLTRDQGAGVGTRTGDTASLLPVSTWRAVAGIGWGTGPDLGRPRSPAPGRSRSHCCARAGPAPWRRARHPAVLPPHWPRAGVSLSSLHPSSQWPRGSRRAGPAPRPPDPAPFPPAGQWGCAGRGRGGGQWAARGGAGGPGVVGAHSALPPPSGEGRGSRDQGGRAAGAGVRVPRGSPSLLGDPRAWVACVCRLAGPGGKEEPRHSPAAGSPAPPVIGRG